MPTHTLHVAPDHNSLRVDVYLAQNLPDAPSRTFVKKLIDSDHVTVNGKIIKPNYKVSAGEEVSVSIPTDFLVSDDIAPEDIPLNIFYEDDSLVVINKPEGLMVHPASGIYTGTLVNALLHHIKKLSDCNTNIRPGIVHRLDRETSGLMVVAKDNKTHLKLAKQFEEHQVRKVYVALVEGRIEFDEGKIDAPLAKHPKYLDKKAVDFEDDAAKEALTYYKVAKRFNKATLVYLFPQTGRTHQLRVHMAHIKHPILGDDKYGRKEAFERLALHAQAIGFMHPKTNRLIEFTSCMPKSFLNYQDKKK